MREIELLNQRAEKCRKLAASANDEEIQRKLVALADEYEAKALRLNAGDHVRTGDA